MCVRFKKLSIVAGGVICALYALGALGISPAWANEAPDSKAKDGSIPVTVTLKGITKTEGPIYVSIQTREDFRSMKGFGGILSEPRLGDITKTYKVDAPGNYAVSIWHDLDNDGQFSMSEDYRILDGWGSSGKVTKGSDPTFEDVKFEVTAQGTSVPVEMKYPD